MCGRTARTLCEKKGMRRRVTPATRLKFVFIHPRRPIHFIRTRAPFKMVSATISARASTMPSPTLRRAGGAVRMSAASTHAASLSTLLRLAAGRSSLVGSPRRPGAAPTARRGSVAARAEISYIMVSGEERKKGVGGR